jgi:DNA-directed RNA polymerase beta subunit
VPLAGRIPAIASQFSKEIAVSKVEDGRVYLIDEESASSYVPSLIEMQIQSYHWFLSEGLKELLEEISPRPQ